MDSLSVKTALQAFFLENDAEEEYPRQCKLCLVQSSNGKVGVLRSDVVKVVQSSLLLQEVLPKTSCRSLIWVCGQCEASLETLTDLFFQLEKLRTQFNDLRKKISREVVVRSLGRSQEEWESFFDEEIKPIEDYYPSVCFLKPEDNLDRIVIKVEPTILPDCESPESESKEWESHEHHKWEEEEMSTKKEYNVGSCSQDGEDGEMSATMGLVEEEESEEQFVLLGPQVQVEGNEDIPDFIIPDQITTNEDIHYDHDDEPHFHPKRRKRGRKKSINCQVEFGRGIRNALDSDNDDNGNDDDETEVDIIHYEGDINHHNPVSPQEESEEGEEEVKTPNRLASQSELLNGQTKKSIPGQRDMVEQVSCLQCGETFSSRYSKMRHDNRYHGIKYSVALEGTRRSHGKKNSSQKTFSCSTCKKKFERYDAAWRCKDKHNGPFICTVCNASFVYSKGRARHMRNAHKT